MTNNIVEGELQHMTNEEYAEMQSCKTVEDEKNTFPRPMTTEEFDELQKHWSLFEATDEIGIYKIYTLVDPHKISFSDTVMNVHRVRIDTGGKLMSVAELKEYYDL